MTASITDIAARRHLPRDVREGQTWTWGQTAKNAFLYVLVRAVLGVLAPWPASALRTLGRTLGRLLYVVLPGERRMTHANLRRAFPALSAMEHEKLARDVYVELGHHLGDTVALLSPRHALTPLPIESRSRAVLYQALAEGRGVVFVSAHLGPWERVAASLVAGGVPLTTLAREGYDPRLTKLFDELRGRFGVRAIYRGSAGAPLRIVRTLRRGGVLGAPMDLRSRVPSIDAPFLGSPAPTAVGPARIALRTGAAVVVGTVARVKNATRPEELEITMTRIDIPPKTSGDAEQALTLALNSELSRRILAFPEGWVWMHPRWPHSP